jgi:hypothetical protein
MKTKLIFCCFLCLICCNAALAGYYDFCNPWSNYGYGGYYQPGYSQDYAPYFALHPPVYYSYRIARTYGDSPFPYPPGFTALQAYSSSDQPQIIKNQHDEDANPSNDQQYQSRMPLRIRNPFVEQSENTEMSKGAKWEGNKMSKPSVIYPASMTR